MKKIIGFVLGIILLGTAHAVAASDGVSEKISNTRVVQATKDTTVTYGGVKVFIPAGQTLILGQDSKGNIIVRGQNLSGVKVGRGTISAQGPVILSVQPKTQVVTVYQGNAVRVTDGHGRTALVSKGASVSAKNIRVSSSVQMNVPAEEETVTFGDELPAFVATTQVSSAASEQAAQDVEETLSPSAPR